MSKFSQTSGQYIVSSNPVINPSQLSGRVELFNEDGSPFGVGGGQRTLYDLNPMALTNSWGLVGLIPPTDGSHDDAVLDLSDNYHPKPLVDGIYSVTAMLSMFPVPGKAMGVKLTLDAFNDVLSIGQNISIDSAIGSDNPVISVSGTYFVPAGSPILVEAGHNVPTPKSIYGHVSVIKLG